MVEVETTVSTAEKISDLETYHPALGLLAELASSVAGRQQERNSKFFLDKELDRLTGIKEKRARFEEEIGKLGLSAIQTPEQFDSLLESQSDYMESLPHDEKFELLIRLRGAIGAGRDLLTIANEYTRTRMALTKPIKKTSQGKIRFVDEIRKYGDNDPEAALPQPHTIIPDGEIDRNRNPVKYEKGVDPIRLRSEDLLTTEHPDYKKEAAEIVHYREWLILMGLYQHLAERFAGDVGRDIVTGEPVIYNKNISSFEEAERFSRIPPDSLQRWLNDFIETSSENLPELKPISSEAAGTLERFETANIVDLLFNPDDDETRRKINDAIRAYYREPDQDTTPSYQERQGRRLERETALLIIKRILAAKLGEIFADCEEPLHPEVERRFREFAAYVLSPKGTKTSHEDVSDSGKPLSQHKNELGRMVRPSLALLN